jgi:hypothetical protein
MREEERSVMVRGRNERSRRVRLGKNLMLAAGNGLLQLKGALTSSQKPVQVESLYQSSSDRSYIADRASSFFLELDRSTDHGDFDRDR